VRKDSKFGKELLFFKPLRLSVLAGDISKILLAALPRWVLRGASLSTQNPEGPKFFSGFVKRESIE
jgi:hypothetical protein